MEKFLQKILAALVAGVIAASGASVLAEKNVASVVTKTPLTIQEDIVAPHSDDICLSDEYVAFLSQNDIQVIDGDIKVDSVSDIEAIALYMQKEWQQKGLNLVTSTVRDFIVAFNIAYIDRDIIQQLVDERLIMPKFRNYDHEDFAILERVANAISTLALSDSYESRISFIPLTFDKKTRQSVFLIESIMSTYVVTARSEGISMYKKVYRNLFLGYFDEMYNFYMSKESIFPYKMNELDRTAPYLFGFLNYCFVTLSRNLTNDRATALARYINTGEEYIASTKAIEPYESDFPKRR